MTEPAKKPRAVHEVTDPPSEPEAAPEPVPAVAAPVLSATQIRANRSRKIGIRFAIFVGFPTLIACVYYLAIATPLYDARAVVAIQPTSPDLDLAAAKTATGRFQHEGHLLAERARAREVARSLHAADLNEIKATVDTMSSAVTLRVRSGSPKRAQALLDKLIEKLTAWVEDQSQSARQQRIAPAERDVADAKAHLLKLQGLAATHAGEQLTSDTETAQLELDAAIDALKHARLEAAHAQIYLVSIDEARADTTQAWPRPLWNIATVMVCAMVLVAVLSLLGAAVREHANF